MKIKTGTKTDIDACVAIAKKLPQAFTEKALIDMKNDLEKHSVYVTLEEDEITGFASINQKNNEVAEISWLAVRPVCQRQGIGTRLLKHVRNELKTQGIKILVVKTLDETSNYIPYESTRKFYEDNGFKHVETIDPYPGWGPDNPCAIYILVL